MPGSHIRLWFPRFNFNICGLQLKLKFKRRFVPVGLLPLLLPMADSTPDDGLDLPKPQKTLQFENRFQQQWADDHIFETAAPSTDHVSLGAVSPEELRAQQPKFFGTMTYPYMNRSLHVGHGFTISKVEFTAGYARMRGKRVLMPLGFHCTGMAIKACADKLAREIDMFGQNFERYVEDLPIHTKTDTAAAASPPSATNVTAFKSNKSKAVAKSGRFKFQFQIMLSLGIPREEIHRFADPYHWVYVFPDAGMRDLMSFGMRVDWRRSFFTTDANYDSFVRWQMNKLKALGKIKFGNEGEGISVQQYTAIKMPVLEWAEDAKSAVSSLPANAKVYFVAATLRPETMYGQTCCFVGPSVMYGIFHVSGNEYFLVSSRPARNMAFQNISPTWGILPKVAEVSGKQVVGTLVGAPLSLHEAGVRGTGIVTSVLSDSPDDYATVTDLTNKPDYYGIQREWVKRDIVPIIETPAYGNRVAPTLVQKHKIQSAKDPKLAELKDIAYKEGFYNGIMLVGDYKGKPVQEAKILVKNDLINSGQAFDYAEPDGLVIIRSKDECVAAHLDQWYLNYGSEENGGDGDWCNQVLGHLNSGDLNTFSTEAKNQFEKTLDWLGQWSFESLTDSTIYPAYYTVAHYLHRDIYGNEHDEVWDYVFALADSVDLDIQPKTLQSMRREFTYWYPLDLRVSGKDLFQNHLTFFMYTHVAYMAKSTGNFLTLRETVAKYGADAARIAMADAGDSIEDANFEEAVANKTILKLYELKKWLKEMIVEPELIGSPEQYAQSRDSHLGKSLDTTQCTGSFSFWDELFQNELRHLIAETEKSYEKYLQALLLAPVAPHWADYIWRDVLGKTTTVNTACFPERASATQAKKLAKGKQTPFNPSKPYVLSIFCTTSLPSWQSRCMDLLRDEIVWVGDVFTLDMKNVGQSVDKKHVKKAIPFVVEAKRRIAAGQHSNGSVLGAQDLIAAGALPQSPTFYFENC
ncbi:leucyl-tRNA synthetase [Xylariaceae sp. AK1471]|nr:leucyl-tRNA synthetase [Xylariaceae sp. AK1471]